MKVLVLRTRVSCIEGKNEYPSKYWKSFVYMALGIGDSDYSTRELITLK